MIPPIAGASFPTATTADTSGYALTPLRAATAPAALRPDTVTISSQALAAQASYRRVTEKKPAPDFAVPGVR